MSDEFDAGRLDDAIHGRLRLGIMAYLSQASPATFNELKEVTGATGGNLSTHLRKLEDVGYIEQVKSFEARKPLTTIHLTAEGRKAFAAYLDALKPLLDDR